MIDKQKAKALMTGFASTILDNEADYDTALVALFSALVSLSATKRKLSDDDAVLDIDSQWTAFKRMFAR